MKVLKKAFLPLFGLGLLASCSDNNMDNPNQGGMENNGDVYMSLTITQDLGTRTSTGTEGEEAAQDNEKAVNDVTIILASKTDRKVLAVSQLTTMQPMTPGTSQDSRYVVTGTFDLADDFISSHFTSNPDFDIYVVCNKASVATTMPAATDANGLDEKVLALSNDYATLWGEGGFLMTGMAYVTSEPTLINPSAANSITNPYNLGTVNVSRAAARFDLDLTKTSYYFKADGNTTTTSSEAAISLEIDGVAVVNMNHDIYMFKQVGPTGEGTVTKYTGKSWNDAEYGTAITGWAFSDYVKSPGTYYENQTNLWVNDPKWTEKKAKTYEFQLPAFASGKMNTPTSFIEIVSDGDEGKKFQISGDDVELAANVPTIKPTTPDGATNLTYSNYVPFSYVVPNTLLDKDEQKNGNSTGVVFRAKMTLGGDNATAKEIYTIGDVVYAYDESSDSDYSTLINTLKTNGTSVAKSAVSTAEALAKEEKNKDKGAEEEEEEPTPAEIAEQLVAAGFTHFTTQTPGQFYCYYWYWNQHNNNNNPNVMDNMEFGVVRNNVYKLAVTALKKLGHPADPEDDPDPNDPDDPDEDEYNYAQVEVVVLPWLVRVNNIEF